MKRLSFISAALLSSALAFPALAQDSSGGTAEQPPIIKQPDAGAAAKTDRPAGQSAEQTQPAPTDGSQSGQSGATAGATDAPATNETAGQQAQPAPTENTAGASGQSGNDAATGTEQQNQAADQNQPVSGETTASVNITQEQKTEIRQVIVESDVKPVDVDFEVNVGVAVPTTVTLAPLPPRVIKLVPQYEGYRFFVLADGRIIIVEPDTLKIVYVLVV
jgi:hypothetical protein